MMAVALAIGFFGGAIVPAAEPVTFEKHVRPILKTHCFLCHGESGVA